MLRVIVITLVLANLLLLGFQASRPASPELKPVVVELNDDSAVPTIHLFQEMVEDRALMSGTRQCFSMGPFHSIEDRNQVRLSLKGLVAGVSERQTQAMVEQGYWVYLPPFETRLEANQTLLSLRALGLKDISVMVSGDEMNNAISLGYFMRQVNANRRQKQLEQRGFAAEVRVRRGLQARYWLDYEQKPGAELFEADLSSQANDFSQRILPCPELGFFSGIEAGARPTDPGPDGFPETVSDDGLADGDER